MMRPLLDDWAAVIARLHKSPFLALFLDFDGTLAPLTADPRKAAMNRVSRLALARLAVNPRVRAWVISGRRQEDLQNLVGPSPGLTLLGVHGADGPGGALVPKEVLARVTEARRELAARLNGTAGVLIEDKGAAFAVHHRAARSADIGRARALLDRVVAEREGALRIVPGDKVWEVLPREVRGKGDAVRREWRLHAPEALPIYIGNDGTDESAFASLAEGITARVGAARPTRARYALRDCAEVARFLERLEEEVRWTDCRAFNS